MSKEELLDGLRKNWYLIAALALVAALAAVKLFMGIGDEPPSSSQTTPAGAQQLPSAPENLETLQAITQPNEQEKARTQIAEYEEKIKAEPEAEDTPAYLMAMGNLYRQKLEELEQAATCYERIIMNFPDSEERREAYLQLEACYLRQEDRTGLKWLYDKMVDEFPEDSQEHLYAAKQRENL